MIKELESGLLPRSIKTTDDVVLIKQIGDISTHEFDIIINTLTHILNETKGAHIPRKEQRAIIRPLISSRLSILGPGARYLLKTAMKSDTSLGRARREIVVARDLARNEPVDSIESDIRTYAERAYRFGGFEKYIESISGRTDEQSIKKIRDFVSGTCETIAFKEVIPAQGEVNARFPDNGTYVHAANDNADVHQTAVILHWGAAQLGSTATDDTRKELFFAEIWNNHALRTIIDSPRFVVIG